MATIAVCVRWALTCAASFMLIGSLGAAHAQTRQVGADANARGRDRLRVDYLGYRPARYETEFLFEPDNERPNEGGLIYVYFTNTDEKAVDLSFWRVNKRDQSHWILSGAMAWSRLYAHRIEPGRT
ncbi:MAG TPA: hypothetical protein ENN80_15485, partial [Candidatus Hydrogenedentes bacterium]|nr:hypothetical protein [Candidatus Hydrogenedentota bacterium]